MQTLTALIAELNKAKATEIKVGLTWISFKINNAKYFIRDNQVIMYSIINRRLYIKNGKDISYIKRGDYDALCNI